MHITICRCEELKTRDLQSISPFVAAEEVLGLRVAEGAAADDVDEDERDGGDEQRDGGLAPLLAQAAQHAGLAGGAGVAELAWVVAPRRAVRVRRRVRRARPHRRAHVRVPAHRRRLAAPGLHGQHSTVHRSQGSRRLIININ